MHKKAVAGPVEVIARIVGEVVAHAVAPAVHVAGVHDFALVVLVLEGAVVELEVDPVLESRELSGQEEVGFEFALRVERRTLEFAIVVYVGVVAEPVKAPRPIFVKEVDFARELVVEQKEQRCNGGRVLVLGGGVGNNVEFTGAAALETGLKKEVAHESVFELCLFGVANYRDYGKALEVFFFGLRRSGREQRRPREASCKDDLKKAAHKG